MNKRPEGRSTDVLGEISKSMQVEHSGRSSVKLRTDPPTMDARRT
jgi:hypothetical protein